MRVISILLLTTTSAMALISFASNDGESLCRASTPGVVYFADAKPGSQQTVETGKKVS
jgi:hypothetical protein